MGIIGFRVHITRDGKPLHRDWHPDLSAVGADTLRAVREALTADGRKHPDDAWPTTIDGFLRPYVRVAKQLKARPNPDDPVNAAKLAALLVYLADDIWFKFFPKLPDLIPATAAEIGPGAVDTPDGPELPNGWGRWEQWEYTLQRAVWHLLGIPADSWEPPAPPPARLRDLLAGSPGERPATRLRDLLGGRN